MQLAFLIVKLTTVLGIGIRCAVVQFSILLLKWRNVWVFDFPVHWRLQLVLTKKWRLKIVPKYPKVKVKLVGSDGNAFVILGKMQQALRKAKVSKEEIDAFLAEAMSGDYDNLLHICTTWVDVS